VSRAPIAWPAAVTVALEARLERLARGPLRAAANLASTTYRQAGTSAQAIRSDADALAYAVVRMPATHAAVARALAEVALPPATGPPISLLDIGAGTGAASLAAMMAFESIVRVDLVEPNPYLAALAQGLLTAAGRVQVAHSGRDATTSLPPGPFDLVFASYMQVELAPAAAAVVVRAALARARHGLVLVEPGTPAGFDRIRAAREITIAAGWTVLAPCPHDAACPMTAGDWCHFKVRLPRSRTHQVLKAAAVPYEDEPYSYLVATPVAATRAPARVLTPPAVSKAQVDLDLCTPQGRVSLALAKRDGAGFKSARKLLAGDAFDPAPQMRER
jgi:ribosomal protein RSM22 (predicted rRNA methylase)